jgi:hypothetical protein
MMALCQQCGGRFWNRGWHSTHAQSPRCVNSEQRGVFRPSKVFSTVIRWLEAAVDSDCSGDACQASDCNKERNPLDREVMELWVVSLVMAFPKSVIC